MLAVLRSLHDQVFMSEEDPISDGAIAADLSIDYSFTHKHLL